jgi:hypothetical protein
MLLVRQTRTFVVDTEFGIVEPLSIDRRDHMAFDAAHPEKPTLTIEGVTVPAHRCASGVLVPILNPEHKFEIEMARIGREATAAGFSRRRQPGSYAGLGASIQAAGRHAARFGEDR